MNCMLLKWLSMIHCNIISLICISAMLASCGCSQKNEAEKEVPTPPSTESFVRMADGNTFESALLKHNVPFSILLPKSYLSEPERRYPVVYMLHGLGDKPESWNDSWLRVEAKIKQLEEAGMGDMIYVFPSGYKTYYCNRLDGGYPYMDMFITEFIPFIDQHYRTVADKGHRAITGYSMGGFGACAMALKHPEMFCSSAPLSMSFRTDQQYMTEEQSGWNSQWGRIFGGSGQTGEGRLTDYYKQHCPFYQFTAENKAAVSGVKWFFTCGDDEEQLLVAGDDLHVQMRQAGIEHEYRVNNGAHTGDYWRNALAEVLPMFDYYMNGGAQWKPLADKTESSRLSYDEAFVSPEWKEGTGTLAILVHNNLDQASLESIMAAMDKSDLSKAFVIAPCDISKKPLADWISSWEAKYPSAKRICVVIGEDSAPALEMDFERWILIDAACSSPQPAIAKGQKVYLACTEDAINYEGMGLLYKTCKFNEATFEYRVLQTSGDKTDNYVRSIKSLISFLIY